MNNLPDEPNLSLCISCLNAILIWISAATTHVWKTKPSKKSKPWVTSHVRSKIHTRNCLHLIIYQTNSSRSMLAVKPLRLSTMPRQKVGKTYLKMQCRILTAQTCGTSSKVWMVLQMPTLQTKLCPTNVEPSPLNMSRVDWDLNRQFKKHLNAPSVDDESCAPL